mgnify:CR=1 FL=1
MRVIGKHLPKIGWHGMLMSWRQWTFGFHKVSELVSYSQVLSQGILELWRCKIYLEYVWTKISPTPSHTHTHALARGATNIPKAEERKKSWIYQPGVNSRCRTEVVRNWCWQLTRHNTSILWDLAEIKESRESAEAFDLYLMMDIIASK